MTIRINIALLRILRQRMGSTEPKELKTSRFRCFMIVSNRVTRELNEVNKSLGEYRDNCMIGNYKGSL